MSRRSSHLTTYDLHQLDIACTGLGQAFPHANFLVGSSAEKADYRDVDVRTILDDEEFGKLFGEVAFWELFCLSVTSYLRQQAGLPIDYQVQRLTEANKLSGSRNPIGIGRRFAGGGDATPYNTLIKEDK